MHRKRMGLPAQFLADFFGIPEDVIVAGVDCRQDKRELFIDFIFPDQQVYPWWDVDKKRPIAQNTNVVSVNVEGSVPPLFVPILDKYESHLKDLQAYKAAMKVLRDEQKVSRISDHYE